MRLTTLLLSVLGLASYAQADHADLVAKAIQQSRMRQSSRVSSANSKPAAAAAAAAGAAAGKKGAAQARPSGQSKYIDVERLNDLIKSFDKTWVHPKAGAKEPVGSNFQYKKTCASIYKARPGACSQLGFGSMCFNYCFEKGEKTSYQCVDASDAAYCKSSSNFDAYLTKYKKDAYKAKAYVHQMISRCFATALCNAKGILDAVVIESSTPKTREMTHLKLTKPSGSAVSKKSPVKTSTTTTIAPEREITAATDAPEVPAKPTNGRPKKVPEWQKLMGKATTTEKSAKKEVEEEEEEEIASTTEAEESFEEVEVEEEETTPAPSTARPLRGGPARKAVSKKNVVTATAAATAGSTTTASRATFKPLKTTASPRAPSSEELAAVASHTGEKTPKEDTFWNRFQPNTWYQSIHYLTNTGR